jgi:hypothetical protein
MRDFWRTFACKFWNSHELSATCTSLECLVLKLKMEPIIQVGAKYSSFEELKTAIEHYKSTKYCQLYVRDSRTIASTLKRTPSRKINENLKYSHLVYACISGGKSFKSRSNGSRPNQRFIFDYIVLKRKLMQMTSKHMGTCSPQT